MRILHSRKSGFRIRFGLNAEPCPAIYLYADPGFAHYRYRYANKKFRVPSFRLSFNLFYLITFKNNCVRFKTYERTYIFFKCWKVIIFANHGVRIWVLENQIKLRLHADCSYNFSEKLKTMCSKNGNQKITKTTWSLFKTLKRIWIRVD